MACQLNAIWDLSALDGITVTTDLPSALNALTRQRCRTDAAAFRRPKRQLVSAGCVVYIQRGQRWRRHVVLDIAYLGDLIDTPASESIGVNIVAHELAHVAFLGDTPNPDWRRLFSAPSEDWRPGALRFLALSLWDEYAACRLAAHHGNYASVTVIFMNCLALRLAPGLPRLSLGTRKHWHSLAAAPAFIRGVRVAQEPLLGAAYLMGHVDGLGVDVAIATLSTSARTSALAPCWQPLLSVLRQIWEAEARRPSAAHLDMLRGVTEHALYICQGAGMLP